MTFLFDLDGTICNTEEGVVNSAIYALNQLGLKAPPRGDLRAFIGPPLKNSLLACGLSDEDADRGVLKFRERYNTIGKLECSLYPGLKALFEALLAKGCRLCVATSKLEEPAREILQNQGVADYFNIIQGSTPDGSLSEKADIIGAILQKLPPQEAVYMIGDTRFDIIGAKKTGIPSVAVGYGFAAPGELDEADHYCATVSELSDFLLAI